MAASSFENTVPGSGLSQNGHISAAVEGSKRSNGSGAKGDGGAGGRLGKRAVLSSREKSTGKGWRACAGRNLSWVNVVELPPSDSNVPGSGADIHGGDCDRAGDGDDGARGDNSTCGDNGTCGDDGTGGDDGARGDDGACGDDVRICVGDRSVYNGGGNVCDDGGSIDGG